MKWRRGKRTIKQSLNVLLLWQTPTTINSFFDQRASQNNYIGRIHSSDVPPRGSWQLKLWVKSSYLAASRFKRINFKKWSFVFFALFLVLDLMVLPYVMRAVYSSEFQKWSQFCHNNNNWVKSIALNAAHRRSQEPPPPWDKSWLAPCALVIIDALPLYQYGYNVFHTSSKSSKHNHFMFMR